MHEAQKSYYKVLHKVVYFREFFFHIFVCKKKKNKKKSALVTGHANYPPSFFFFLYKSFYLFRSFLAVFMGKSYSRRACKVPVPFLAAVCVRVFVCEHVFKSMSECPGSLNLTTRE